MFGTPLLDYGTLLLLMGLVFFIVYLLHRKSSEMSVFSIIILYIIVFFAVIIPIMMRIGSYLHKEPPKIYMVLFLVALVGIPAHLIKTIIGRGKKRKGATYITLEDDCVTGIGEIVTDGSGFGGVSFGTGGIRPVIGGTPAKSQLRGFKVPYGKIIGVDLLVQKPGIILMTQVANYICYIDNGPAVQEAVIKRIS